MGWHGRAWNQSRVPGLPRNRRCLRSASTADTRDEGWSINRFLGESAQSPTRVGNGVSGCQLDNSGQLLFADADTNSRRISFSGSPD